VLVLGESGIGKTSLCRELASNTDERTFFTALLDWRLGVEDVLGQLLSDFGLLASTSVGGNDRGQLQAAVKRFLVSLKPLGARAVVVVDDAERVDRGVLETLCNLAAAPDARGQLRVVLVGQPALEARLREPGFSQLQALVGGRVRLAPLDRDEILSYVAHRADHGGDAAGGTLPADRLAQVYEQSEGIPARVNFFAARPAQADVDLPVASPDEALRRDATEEPTAPEPRRRSRTPLLLTFLVLVIVGVAGWFWAARGGRGSSSPVDGRTVPTTNAPGAPQAPAATASAPASPEPSAVAPTSGPAPATDRGADGPSPTGEAGAGSRARTDDPVGVEPPATGAAPAPASGQGRYRITVASFRTAARAEAIAAQLQQRNLPVTTRVDATGIWHQVLAGPYPTLEAARDVQRTLSAAGFPDTLISLPPATEVQVPDPAR
jgi:type II secretory pathway predicted ATPase ExeA/cell division protein FtsN